MKTHRSTRASRRQDGQILVVAAGGMVLFLAIAALVIDLGFVFMLRRQEQNAADPGAIAAARYIPSADRAAMWTAACFYASQNGFTPRRSDNNASCVAGVPADDSTLTVNWPPSRAAAEYAGDRGYVEVTITRFHESFFAGIVGLTAITVATAAVAANDTGAAGSSSLIALNDTQCSAAKIHGGGSGGGLYIFPATGLTPGTGGYVQVNSICGYANGANDNCLDGSDGGLTIAGGTTVTSNTIYIQGGCNVNGSVTINPPTTFDERAAWVGDPLSLIRPPSPGDLPLGVCPTGTTGTAANPNTCKLSGTQVLNPGTYYGGWQVTKDKTSITLNPGIYILAGGGFTQTGGSTVAAASGRVLIYSTDAPTCGTAGAPPEACQGIIDFRGSTSLNLRGLDKNTACLPYGSTGCPFGGLLFWQDAKASGTSVDKSIDLEGSGSLYLEGTIYTAGGDVTITGNGLSTGCTADVNGNTNCAAVQIISDTWDVGGAGVLNMPYDPSKFYNPMLKGLVR
jgi:Putative Flp pilus-assembly TadE/G-like